VILVNAAHMKNVPGRKTDVADAAWIAQFVEHGLLRASFVPPRDIPQLRSLTHYRRTLVNERTLAVQRLEKAFSLSWRLDFVARPERGPHGPPVSA
jgi:transposase